MKGIWKQPIAVDLFCGAGGMSLGFEQAGFEIVAGVEYDPIHSATHEFNFPQCAPICRNVADIDGAYIRAHSKLQDRRVDVVFGGAPCQGFSMIGKRALSDPRNALVNHFVRLVIELRASYFVFENVRGLTIGEHRRFLEEIIQEFHRNGYRVLEDYRVLNAAHYGVPQDRKRLFLLGARKGLPLPEYPEPTHEALNGAKNPHLFLKRTPTVWDALRDLPEADDYAELLERDWVNATFKKPTAYSAPLHCEIADGDDYSAPRKFEPTLLTSSLRTVHTALSKRRFLETEHGAMEPISRFLKLDPEGICNTIRAGTASDRGAFTSPRPIHPYSPRCITVREAARLHSYPDWFRFHVTKWHGFRQIGNSVPPLLARAVASKIREVALDEAPRKNAALLAPGGTDLLSLDMSKAAARYGVPSNTVAQRKRPEKRSS
jgi:DNA (cytosine-5)-methyltransferase 1